MTRQQAPWLRGLPELPQRLGDMWQGGLDILEYLDAGVVRERVAQGTASGRHGLRRTASFVLVAALLNSLFALAAGVLGGTALESWLRSLLDFFVVFVVTVTATFGLGRVLGAHVSFKALVYGVALFSVPLQVLESLLVVAASLVPLVGYALLLLVTVLAVVARVYLLDLVASVALFQFGGWRRWVMLVLFVLLAVLGSGLNVLV